MTDTSDKREDVVYIYVNSFEYKEKTYQEMMGGHPLSGRVYRALFDKKNGLYRILFDSFTDTHYTGLVVKDLITDDPRWSSNFEVLSDDSILEKEINAEDFLKLAKWKEEGNKDIDQLRVEQNIAIPNKDQNGITKIVFEQKDEVLETNERGNIIEELHQYDPQVAAATEEAILGIIAYLQASEGLDGDLTKIISFSQRNGKGANCGIAIEALTEYLHNDSYLSSGTLIKAVYYLLRELSRINKNG
jgi:hypothetical protein